MPLHNEQVLITYVRNEASLFSKDRTQVPSKMLKTRYALKRTLVCSDQWRQERATYNNEHALTWLGAGVYLELQVHFTREVINALRLHRQVSRRVRNISHVFGKMLKKKTPAHLPRLLVS